MVVTRGNHIKVIKSVSKRHITHFLSFVSPRMLDIQNQLCTDDRKVEAKMCRGAKGIEEHEWGE